MAKLKKEGKDGWGWVSLFCLWSGFLLVGGVVFVGGRVLWDSRRAPAPVAEAVAVSGAAGSPRFFEDLTKVVLVEVHDGDTIVVDLPDEKKLFGYHRLVRLAHVDAPELRDSRPEIRKLAQEAKALVQETLSKAKKISLRKTTQDDKYGRILCEVWADRINVGELLVREGLAKPYEGGSKARIW